MDAGGDIVDEDGNIWVVVERSFFFLPSFFCWLTVGEKTEQTIDSVTHPYLSIYQSISIYLSLKYYKKKTGRSVGRRCSCRRDGGVDGISARKKSSRRFRWACSKTSGGWGAVG